MKRTDFSVLVKIPLVALMRSRGNHDVDTLGSQNLQACIGVSQGLRLFGPHAGCVDDVLCAYVQALAGLQVCQLCADDAAGCILGEADNLGAGCSQCAVACSGADDVDDEACVVNACIVELDCAAECGVLDVGENGLGACLGEVAAWEGTPLWPREPRNARVSYMPMPIAEYARS